MTCFLIFLLLSIILLQKQRIKLAKWVLSFTLITLFLSSTPACSHVLLSQLESQFIPLKLSEAPEAQAIVVLGGSISSLMPPRVQPEESNSSVLSYAARLFHLKKSPLIIVSGGGTYQTQQNQTRTESLDMKDYLTTFGVPEAQIIQEDRSRNTEENVLYTGKVLEKLHIRRVILITKAYHMPRAMRWFRKHDLDITPFPTDLESDLNFNLTQLLPSSNGLGYFTIATKEFLGMLFWRLFN